MTDKTAVKKIWLHQDDTAAGAKTDSVCRVGSKKKKQTHQLKSTGFHKLVYV